MNNKHEKYLVIEPIIGYRGFLAMSPSLYGICSYSLSALDNKINVSKCKSVSHKSPNWGCNCGFYAYKSKNLLVERIFEYSVCLVGTVELTGIVIEHEFGYRAEKMKIKNLVINCPYYKSLTILDTKDLNSISDYYNVPLIDYYKFINGVDK